MRHVLPAAALLLAACVPEAARDGRPVEATAAPEAPPTSTAAKPVAGPDPCAGLVNALACARAVEALSIAELRGRVRREGLHLHLALTGGGYATLTDNPYNDLPADQGGNAAESLTYAFQEYLPALAAYLIYEQPWEGGRYLLVDERSGEVLPLADRPVVSPGGTRLVSMSAADESGYYPNRIEIFRVTPTGLEREYRLDLHEREWGPVSPSWQGEDVIRFQRELRYDQSGSWLDEPRLLPALLRRTPAGAWLLEALP